MRFLNVISALVFVFLATAASAEDGELQDCSQIIGKWYNSLDVEVNLTIADAACNYTLAARYGVIGPDRGRGTASIEKGKLVIPFKCFMCGETDRFILRHVFDTLTGTVVVAFKKPPITLLKTDRFPVDF